MNNECHYQLIMKDAQYHSVNPVIIMNVSYFLISLTIYDHSKPLLWVDTDQEIAAMLSVHKNSALYDSMIQWCVFSVCICVVWARLIVVCWYGFIFFSCSSIIALELIVGGLLVCSLGLLPFLFHITKAVTSKIVSWWWLYFSVVIELIYCRKMRWSFSANLRPCFRW